MQIGTHAVFGVTKTFAIYQQPRVYLVPKRSLSLSLSLSLACR
jgi:hypothetical protein